MRWKSRQAGALAALLGLIAAAPAPRSAPFGDAVVVREADVLTEPPPLRGYQDDPQRWLVLEDGFEREVVRVEPLDASDAEPWDLVLWLDPALASPAVRLHAGAALSRTGRALAARGPLALWVDGREVGRRGEARGIETMIADAAAASTSGDVANTDLAALTRSVDDLLRFADERPRSGPGLLLLPTDPLPVPPDASAPAQRLLLERLDAVAAVLTAYGWAVLVLPFRAPSDDLAAGVDQRDDYERWRDEVATGSDVGGLGGFGVRFPRRRKPISVERTATQVDPALIHWRRFVAPGGGWVVDAEDQLERALTVLAGRRRLWYRTAAPLDGALRSIEMRWRPTGQATRAQQWRRAGTPEVVSEARARAIVTRRAIAHAAAAALDARANRQGLPPSWWRLGAGDRQIGGLVLEVAAGADGRLEVRALSGVPEAPAADRRARLTCVTVAAGDAIAVRHLLRPWAASWRIDCPSATAVLLEDLATGAFGWRWL